MNKLNFNMRRVRVNEKLLSHAKAVLNNWLYGEIKGDEFVALNPLREDNNIGSFKINLTTGVWNDFALDDFSGPDLVSLYMALNDLNETAALDELKKYLSDAGFSHSMISGKQAAPPTKTEVQSAPAPSDCHLPPDIHPDLGIPSMTWDYMTAEGQHAFSVYRFDTDKEKETRPLSYNPEKKDYQWKLPALPLPLYNLDRISADNEVPMVVTEGEKAADAATTLFPEFVSTTSASGCSNALKSDWSQMYGREATLIPDADEPGMEYAHTVGAELLVNGSQVFIVDTLALGWTDGDDVADYPELDQAWLLEHRVPLRDWDGFTSMDECLVEAAARLSPLDYDRCKDDLVKLLGGVNKRTLDSLVKKARQANVKAEETELEDNSLFAGEEPWPEPVDGKGLLTEIQSIIRSHVILSAHEALAVALWILLTYVFLAFRVCPRLLVTSPEKRCGKTTLLETIQALCYRGLAAANISAAALFRGIEAWAPTLLIDEADTFLQKNDELRGILNSGHTKSTAYVIRTVGDEHEPKFFQTFAPIAIGMIKRPPDTLLDRSVVIRLQRKLGVDPVVPLPLEAENDYLPIRQKCLRWTEDNIDQLQGDRELTPTDIDNDRARDNWMPLTAIAQQCGLLVESQDACRQLTLKEDESLTVMLLEDIQQVFCEEGKEKLPSKVLVKKLVGMEERPWSEYSRGKPLTQAKLAQMMRDFDIHTHQARYGAKNLKHYFLKDLNPIFTRYLKTENPSASSEKTATSLHQTTKPDNSRVSAAAEDVAVAHENTFEMSADDEGCSNSMATDVDESDRETLPLKMDSPPAPSGLGLQPCSDVAADMGGTTNTSANQGGR